MKYPVRLNSSQPTFLEQVKELIASIHSNASSSRVSSSSTLNENEVTFHSSPEHPSSSDESFTEDESLLHLLLTPILSAMTNQIFVIDTTFSINSHTTSNIKYILRIYGENTDNFISRDTELFWLGRLAQLSNTPSVIAEFKNGRVESFVYGETLTEQQMKTPFISELIAKALAKLHDLDCVEGSGLIESELWSTLFKWEKLLQSAVDKLELDKSAYNWIKPEITRLRDKMTRVDSVPVLCHNDAQYGNILISADQSMVTLVDFEYASMGCREYDIANHFCEWAANYHCESPHLLDPLHFPTNKQQARFLTAYFTECALLYPNVKLGPMHVFQKRIIEYMQCSHLLWGMWGVIQSASATISFDYLGYADCRFALFHKHDDTSFL